ncbi:MAG: hypothetical protein Q7R76_03875 [Candidatus Woesearchaeota archaeon]|nr:hypothetical protein [Candidatus Woesearchaeota archaeon]
MEERTFARNIFLIIAVVAVVGLLSTGSLDITGFASKKSKKSHYQAPAPRETAESCAMRVFELDSECEREWRGLCERDPRTDLYHRDLDRDGSVGCSDPSCNSFHADMPLC